MGSAPDPHEQQDPGQQRNAEQAQRRHGGRLRPLERADRRRVPVAGGGEVAVRARGPEPGADRQEMIEKARSQLMLTGTDADRIEELVSAFKAVVDEPPPGDETVMRLLGQIEDLETENSSLKSGLHSASGSAEETGDQLQALEKAAARSEEDRGTLETKLEETAAARERRRSLW